MTPIERAAAREMARRDRKMMTLFTALLDIAAEVGRAKATHRYSFYVTSYPWPDDPTGETWMLMDEADEGRRPLCLLRWDAAQERWNREFVDSAFAALIEGAE